MEHETIKKFDTDPIPKIVINNVIPSVISMIMVLIYNLADTFFIGQTNDAYMVAAASLATPVFMIFLAIGMIFGIGGTSLISRTLGMGNIEKAKQISSFAFWSALFVGILCMIGILAGMDSVIKLVGASEDTYTFVYQYLSIVAIGIPFLVVSTCFGNTIRAEGKPKVAMTGMILGNFLNIILDPILILGFDLDIKGAAIATTIGNFVSMMYYLIFFFRKKSMLSISPKKFKVGGGIATGLLSIGIPASFNSMMMSISIIILNNFMAQYGDMAIAAVGVSTKLAMMLAMVLIGIGTGVQPIFGYYFGSKNKKRFNETLRFSLVIAFVVSIIMTLTVYFGTDFLVNAFLEEKNALNYGIEFARILVISGPILGFLFVLNNAIQGVGAAVPALILSLSRQGLIYVPVLTIFNAVFSTANGLIAAQPVADYLATTLAAVLLIIVFKSKFNEKYLAADENLI